VIRKLGLIIFLIGVYVAVVSIDDKKAVVLFAQKYGEKYYHVCQKKIKNMNIEVRVNKWVYDKKP
jgi:hypothetical protein